MFILDNARQQGRGLRAWMAGSFLLLSLVCAATASAQVLVPPQVSEEGVACPADQPDPPNNFVCTSNDITLTLVELTNLVSCTEGQVTSASFDVDLSVNANVRYNPMIWISQNGIDPRVTGAICFVSSVPDGPLTHIPELLFADANTCADIDVPSNNFILDDLELGPIQFLCEDTDGDGKAEIPIIVTWENSVGAACAQGGPYPINQTPSKCDAFTAETDITVIEVPGLDLTKSGVFQDESADTFAQPGETVDYTLTVENTGNVVLTNVSVTDPLITDPPNSGSISCPGGNPIPSLGVGATVVCTATYAVTQTDINFGAVLNTATATSGQESATANANVPLPQNPAIQILKTGTLNAGGDGIPQAGETISYAFSVQNTGNITLTNVTVTDPVVTVSGGPLASLAPGATNTTTFTASYVLTQADIDAGTFTNTATVTTAEGPTDTDDDTQTLAQDIELTLVKTATPQTYTAVSQNINYSFQLTNTGNVTLSAPFGIVDDVSTDEACPGTPTSLAPGASITCTATHTITQGDLDAGSVTNTAQGSAVDPDAQTVNSNQDSETVDAVRTGSLVLLKTATPGTYDEVGDVISYTFRLTNGTNVTLYPPYTVDDDVATDEFCPATPTSLLPGEFVECTASHTITLADLDAGSVTNTASGTAQDPDDQTVTSNQDTETVTANLTGSLTLVKSATPQTYTAEGEVISYSYLLTNNTNQTLSQPFTIDDDVSVDESCPGTPASLAPGESITCTASHTITAGDLTAGSVTNTATGQGFDPNDSPVTSNPDTETVNAVIGDLSLVKSATPQTYDSVGDVITYSYLLTNEGNFTLVAPFAIDDDIATDESCPGTPTSLAPSASITCTASHTISQADLDAQSVTNVATGTARDQAGQEFTSNQDTENVSAVRTGSLALVKSATPQAYTAAGEVIAYSYLLTNNTNITLHAPYSIDDDVSVDETCPAAPATLAPNGVGTVTCTASHTISAGDVTAGFVTNTATGAAHTASVGDGGGETLLSNPDSETVSTVLVNLAKTAAAPTFDAGTGRYTVVSTITASNGGAAAGSYDLTDTFAPASGITLFSAVLSYGGGETQTGTLAGALPFSFSSGETLVTGEGLAGGATETWTVTAQFAVDPAQIDGGARGCVPGQETAGQGFYDVVSGVAGETDTGDNDACTNLPDASIDLSKTASQPSYLGGTAYRVVYTVTANNTGQGPGFYDLSDTIDPGAGITVTQAQLTAYNAGTENAQTGTLGGALPYAFVSGATVVTGEALAAARTESWTITVEFSVTTEGTDDTLLCSDTAGGAGTGFYNRVDGSDSDPNQDNNSACVSPTGGNAYFRVTKDFSDNNPAKISVEITCNTGLPLQQQFIISETTLVNFVVSKYNPGTMDCWINEIVDGVQGYSTDYTAGATTGQAGSISDDAEGCYFDGILGGQFTCALTNTLDPVDIVVTKEWLGDLAQIEVATGLQASAQYTCYDVLDAPDGTPETRQGTLHFDGNSSDSITGLYPWWGGSARCEISENIAASGVEADDSDCESVPIAPGTGGSCTISNTMFFEGIPTLNQYGLALLVLLMLGVGAIGLRRFA